MGKKLRAALSVFTLLAGLPHAGTSKLWGSHGELWDPRGRLPDFSYAGYHAGAKPIPTVPVSANVRDLGCKGDGKTDDSQCLQAAIDGMKGTAAAPAALLIPKGRYLLTRQILVRKSGVVLRGEGSGADGTILYWTKGLQTLTGQQYPWNWGVSGLLRFAPPVAAALAKTADHPPSSDLALGSLISTVAKEAKRGDNTLELANASALQPGQYVVLTLTDPPDKSLSAHLHNNQGSDDLNQDMPLRWVVQVDGLSGNAATLHQPLRFDVRAAWKPQVNAYRPIEESGLEHIRFEYPDHLYPGHQEEVGYNTLGFEGALNCWAVDITSRFCDNGPTLEELTKNCSVIGFTQLPNSSLAFNGLISGHHGFSFNINSHDNLLQDFDFQAVFIHGVSVGYNASGNVARNGKAKDLNLDHHSRSPFENLYDNIDMGSASYPYLPISGAGGPVLRSGARGTVWNVRTSKGPVPPPTFAYTQYNVIGTTVSKETADREWEEIISDLTPADLFQAQLEKRLGPSTGVRIASPRVRTGGLQESIWGPLALRGGARLEIFDLSGRSIANPKNLRTPF
jgi:hypothetical protein